MCGLQEPAGAVFINPAKNEQVIQIKINEIKVTSTTNNLTFASEVHFCTFYSMNVERYQAMLKVQIAIQHV